MTDNWAETLRKESSRLSVDSVDVADFTGNCTRGSCSTYTIGIPFEPEDIA